MTYLISIVLIATSLCVTSSAVDRRGMDYPVEQHCKRDSAHCLDEACGDPLDQKYAGCSMLGAGNHGQCRCYGYAIDCHHGDKQVAGWSLSTEKLDCSVYLRCGFVHHGNKTGCTRYTCKFGEAFDVRTQRCRRAVDARCPLPRWKKRSEDKKNGILTQNIEDMKSHHPVITYSDYGACHEGICENGGKCAEVRHHANMHHVYHTCLCPMGFTGKKCEFEKYNSGDFKGVSHVIPGLLPGDCTSTPCDEDWTCAEVGRGAGGRHMCFCFYNSRCEQQVRHCNSDPCTNGGRCLEVKTGQFFWEDYVCECPEGFTGRNCEKQGGNHWKSCLN